MYRAKLLQSPGIRSEMIHALMAALYEKNPPRRTALQTGEQAQPVFRASTGPCGAGRERVGNNRPFHDIGKVSIPESILNKAGELTDHDWEQIRRHPEVGGTGC